MPSSINDGNPAPPVAATDAVSPARPQVALIFHSAMRRLPELSVVAVLLTAIFNVGFFAEIGLHFIGTMDITNLIYSFALVFSILFAILQAAFIFAHHFLQFTADPRKAWLKSRWWYSIAFMVLAAIYGLALLVPSRYVPDILLISHPYGLAIFWSFMAIAQLTSGYLWLRLDILTLTDVGAVVFAIVAAVGYSGKAVAYEQIFATQRYTIITHSGVIHHAAIVRTSPTGFLIAVDGTIGYYPTSEIRSVAAEVPIKP